MPLSNEQIAAALSQTAPYRSEWTGSEVDEAVGRILAIDDYVHATIQVPRFTFRGGVTRFPMLQFTRRTWLKSVVFICVEAFTDSSLITNYSLVKRSVGKIVDIPNTFFKMVGSSMELQTNIDFLPNDILDLEADNAISTGKMRVKLILD